MFKFKAVRVISVVITFSLFPVTTLTQVQNPPQTPATSPPEIVNTQTDVVRISTELVQTDVAVIDKQGNLVDGLTRDKFELFVDGKPQTIAFFERVTAGSSKEAAVVASASKGSPASTEEKATTSIPASAGLDRGRTTLFFIDDLHLSPGSVKRTQDLLLKFVNQSMKPKDQALIGTASGQLGFLQQVTDNRDVLRTAIDRLRYRPSDVADTLTSPPMNEHQAIAIESNNRDALGYFTDRQCEEFKKMGRGSCAPDTGMTNNAVYDDAVARNRGGGGTTGTSPGPLVMSEETGRRGAVRNQLRPEAERMVRARAKTIASLGRRVTLNTLNSLESLIRSAAGIPERKVVIFISDGFLLSLAQSTSGYDLRRITDAALRSGAVIYTIDARGLVGGGPDASTKDGLDTTGKFTRLTMSEITALQEGLNALANDTGGRAWRNSNDLAPGIGRALEETSAYYLLAWRPEGPAQTKDSFRRIEVKIKDRPDLTVRVRSGFFAKDPVDSKASETTKALSDDDYLLAAIRASFPRNGIPLALSIGYLDKADEGMVLAASVQIDLNTEEPGATIADSEINVIGSVVDDSGNILSSLKQKVTIPASDVPRNGPMILTLQFPKLAPGLRQVRIAARDSKSGRLGSAWQWVEIPNLTSAGLALSSIFLTDGSTTGSQKPSIKPDGRFTQAGKLRFQTYVYNAIQGGSKPNLVLQLELRRDGQKVIQTPLSPVTTEGVTDLARIPIVGEFPLTSFPPGLYELSLVVTDQSSNKSASQRITFSIR